MMKFTLMLILDAGDLAALYLLPTPGMDEFAISFAVTGAPVDTAV